MTQLALIIATIILISIICFIICIIDVVVVNIIIMNVIKNHLVFVFEPVYSAQQRLLHPSLGGHVTIIVEQSAHGEPVGASKSCVSCDTSRE